MAPLIAAALAAAPMLLPVVQRLIRGDASAADIAGDVAKVATQVLGTAEPDAVRAALADPAKVGEFGVQLAQIAADREAEANRAEEERLRVTLADVADARAQTIALAQAGSWVAAMPAILTLVILVAFLLVLAALLLGWTGVVEGTWRDAALRMIGALDILTAGAVAYWIGTSRGAVEMRRGMQAGSAPATPPPLIAATGSGNVVLPPPSPSPPGTTADALMDRYNPGVPRR